jgi:hypothetical protein
LAIEFDSFINLIDAQFTENEMKLKQTRLHILHQPKDLSKEAKTGVSLHCHTEYSKEMLDFVPVYADKLPIIAYFWKKERESYLEREGKSPDFSTAYWSPPMTPAMVYNSEKEQINQVGLEAITSITDHDCIDANLQLGETTEGEKAPISLEWTVPFEYGFFPRRRSQFAQRPRRRTDENSARLHFYQRKSQQRKSARNVFDAQ